MADRIHPKTFADNERKIQTRPLPYINRAAHHTDAALSIEPQLHARLRHVVPVDRQTRAADIRAASNADSLSVRKLLISVLDGRILWRGRPGRYRSRY